MSRLRNYSLLILGVLSSALCGAVELRMPMELESTQVLPRGVRNPRFKNLMMDIRDRYTQETDRSPLGQRLNKQVTWQDVIDARDNDYDKELVRSILAANGIDPNSSPGSTTGQVNTHSDARIPILAYGLTERLTLAAAVPVIRVDVAAGTGFTRSAEGQKFIEAVSFSDPVRGQEAADKLNDAVNQKLTRYGYEPIRSFTQSSLGDIRVVGKYQLLRGSISTFGLKADVTIPTGIKPNANRVIDPPVGNGYWSTGQYLVHDLALTSDLTWNVTGGVNWNFAHTLERRIPLKEGDPLSPDREVVSHRVGHQLLAASSLQYRFPSLGLSTGVGYSVQYQGPTRFQGALYSPERYLFLEGLYPSQTLQAATATLGFSTVDFFKAKKFPLPFQTNVAFSKSLSGRNAQANDLLAAEMVLFF